MNNSNIVSVSTPDQKQMREEYDSYLNIRRFIVKDLKKYVEKIIKEMDPCPTVISRIKSFSSFYRKYLKNRNERKDLYIMDLIGLRIICPFSEDQKTVISTLNKHFKIIETEEKKHNTFKEFGYESTHLIFNIPDDLIAQRGYPGTNIAEIQVRTILMNAWAEVEHELVYKAELNFFDGPMKRKLAAINASLTLADIVFQEIREHQRRYTELIRKRRKTFYQKVEKENDIFLFEGGYNQKSTAAEEIPAQTPMFETGLELATNDNISIDDLLISALSAHNQNRFSDAICQYSRILELNPNDMVCSIIYKHRGMANFACSKYNDAINDFNRALEYDKKSYKAAYYRGVVHSVTKEYSLAIDDYTRSLSINPYQSFCLFRRGQAYYHIGDYPQALSDCDNSLSLEPGNETVIKFKNLLRDKLAM
ncbi:MAG: tetratricopeptide repeat protein [Treponema sp.]|nr:tetratricopeptide repeat protein [Treponema sp.]